MIGPGTARVRLEVLAPAPAGLSGLFAVQIGAFRDRNNADAARLAMERRYGAARLVKRDGSPPLWRVLVGATATLEEAGALADRIRSDGSPAFVVRVDTPESD
jgi:cell division septation protein DedD